MIQVSCFQCKKVLEYKEGIGLRDECPQCHADVHVCLNCKFYDRAAYNECREPSAEVVRVKDRANFCDYFVARGSGSSGEKAKSDLLGAAEALFKKKE